MEKTEKRRGERYFSLSEDIIWKRERVREERPDLRI